MRQKSSLSRALTTSEASQALQLLMQHAPEMITQEQQVSRWLKLVLGVVGSGRTPRLSHLSSAGSLEHSTRPKLPTATLPWHDLRS